MMLGRIRNSIVSKLIIAVGLTLMGVFAVWAYFNIRYQKKNLMADVVEGTDRLTDTFRLGTHYAMMLNSRDDINQIINNVAKLEEIEHIRIYNKKGQIKFSNRSEEIDRVTQIKSEACDICHVSDPPKVHLDLAKRVRIFQSPQGYRKLGVISPIYNEPGCYSGVCHFHPKNKQILGALDVVVSLAKTDKTIVETEKGIIVLVGIVFLFTSFIIFLFVLRLVNEPIRRLISGTRLIAKGQYHTPVDIQQDDEIGMLAASINRMGREIGKKQDELNRQRDEYQSLFEEVPCLITVQDREFRLLKFNRQFGEMFAPAPGDFCYHAYKGRNEKCVNCPVEKTFEDGLPHKTEESGINKDGSPAHWLVRTSPVDDEHGNIIAAMEISLDISDRKQLEIELEKSEKKYHDIFNHIPNPVFVLDYDTLKILDCNRSAESDYSYTRNELIQKSFTDLFASEDKQRIAEELQREKTLNQARHEDKNQRLLIVNIRISLSEYPNRKVLLVTTSDITKRLEAEQQLIQASKMATLGEMATGIAHELNQPLSVIKTASSFFLKKCRQDQKIDESVLVSILTKVDKNADRATNIIQHMRQFARKSGLQLERVEIDTVLKNAFEIFSQQFRVRGIELIWQTGKNLPKVMVDPGRLEQVFINLLLNARDAIEEKFSNETFPDQEKRIVLKSWADTKTVFVEIIDSGPGIPSEIADKIFEPFFTTKEVGKGTGLGLSISYGIVQDCQGSLSAKNVPGMGASFRVSLPIALKEELRQ